MARFAMMVQSKAHPGQEDEYNRWYDDVHLPELLQIPGVLSGTRYSALDTGMFPGPDAPYMAVYEIEADDAQSFLANFAKRSSEGSPVSPAMDMSSIKLWLYAKR